MSGIPLSQCPPDVRRAAEAVARQQGLAVPSRGRRRRPEPAALAVPSGPPAAALSPLVQAWEWRVHKRCGWAGLGPCLFCEGGAP